MTLFKKAHILLVMACLLIATNSFSQSPSLIEYGQNRVQYKKFKWQFYETDNFRIYFYQGAQDIGKYVILNSEKIFEEMSKSLDFRLKRKLDIIVYNDISDLRQSNIGLDSKEQIENGQVKLLDNKLFVYFNGKHNFIDEQIREGITKIFINKYVTGSGLKETFRNSVTANFPKWYTRGLIAYNSKKWDTEYENQLKDGILSGKFSNLLKLNEDEMSFVGHSLWNYVEKKYGKEAVDNLMYLVKINRSIDRGFNYVTGKRFNQFLEEWYYHYLDRYKKEKNQFKALNKDDFVDVPIKKNLIYHSSKLNPDGKSIAYLTNEEGRWKVNIYNIVDEQNKVVFRGGFKTNTIVTDLMNPLIAWDQRGKTLTIIYELRDRFFIRNYNTEEEKLEKETPIRKFQKIYDFSYAEDSRNLIMSAMQKGQIDIFKYYLPSTKVTQITNDFYDDLQASYFENEKHKGYLFISNRKNDTILKAKLDTVLPNGSFDVFFYDLNGNNQKLIQITSTPNANESFPQAFNDESFTFLSDANGINNRYVGDFESKKVRDKLKYIFTTNENKESLDSIVLEMNQPIDSAMEYGQTLQNIVSSTKIPIYRTVGVSYTNSNFNNAISEFSNSTKTNKNLDLVVFNQKPRFVLSDNKAVTEKNKKIVITDFIFNKQKLEKLEKQKVQEEKKRQIQQEESIDFEDEEVYQSKFTDWKDSEEEAYKNMLLPLNSGIEETSSNYKFSRTRQYFLKFKADDFNFSIDNKLLITPYQKFTPNNPVYNNAAVSGFIKLGIKDLFENHKIHGGFRISNISIIPREFYITYENLTNRLDKELTYYRNSVLRTIEEYEGIPLVNPGTEALHTNYAHLRLKFALDELNSMRFKIAYRHEKTVTKSTEYTTLNSNNFVNNWAILKLEFVHDNTIQKAPNILNGFRANGYVEFQKEFPTKDTKVFGSNLKLPSWNNGYLFAFGADVRHYQKVYKTITWTNRLAFASSLGTRKIVYYLGGSDGQIAPKFENRNEVSTDKNYAFQALAQNMRGFPQNTRNGNSYIVLNSELRVPIFSAFSKSTMKSKFLESVQLVAFFDVGTAWEGLSPWSDDNIYRETRYNSELTPTAIVKLNIYKDPVVFAFGPGLRANIFGYFLRMDVGWGYDTGEIVKPKVHFSMTHDF